ncbi:uncharacterized protein TNCV_858911 [Trichonephila clavipes]|nr:uncharacterized protein TNCV_858911 [Trichonephila clavipes]
MISQTYSIGDRSGDLIGQGKKSALYVATAIHCVWDNPESAPAVIGNCSPDHDSRYVNLAADSLIAGIPWCPSDQHTAITGIKAEPAFIKKHYRSLLRPPMSSDVTPHSLPNNTVVG